MSYAHHVLDPRADHDAPASGIAPGKRTMTASIQCKPSATAAAPGPAPVAPGPPAADASVPFWFADGPPHGGGNAMPAVVQAKMERAFQADFSDVRVHEGGEAAGLGAVAYAQGADLHFAPGAYDPHGAAGQELLGHELAHVVQQREGRVQPGPQGKDAAINRDAELEAEADAQGAAAARGDIARAGAISTPGGAAAAIQRKIDPNKEQYVGRRVQGSAGLGYIVALMGQGYTVAFDEGPVFYEPADNLDFVDEPDEGTDKKRKRQLDVVGGNKLIEVGETGEQKGAQKGELKNERTKEEGGPKQAFEHGMANPEILGVAAQGVAEQVTTIAEAGDQWVSTAFDCIVVQLISAYPGMPPIQLMSLQDILTQSEQLGESSPDASFHEDIWEIYVDPKYLQMKFSPENLVKLSEFVVHELRHADQYWRAAMARIQQGQQDDQIAEELGIPVPIVEAARTAQQKESLALGGNQLGEAKLLDGKIPEMNEANENTKLADAFEAMISLAQEHLAHEEEKWSFLEAYSQDKGDPKVLIAWYKREKLKLSKLEPEMVQLELLVEKIDEDSEEGLVLARAIAALELKIKFARDAIADVDAFLIAKTMNGEEWQAKILDAIEEHEKDIQGYRLKIWEAIQAYRDDPLENDGRWCGAVFAKKLGAALDKK